jgi:hypothetical protein
LEKDLERLSTAQVFDLPGLLIKLDEGVALVDGLVLANQALPTTLMNRSMADAQQAPAPSWWMAGLTQFADQLKGLVRVSRIESPEAALLSPEQGFFLRENLKLKLLNARLGLLARQKDAARNDLGAAAVTLIWTQLPGDPHPYVVILASVAGAWLATWLQRYVTIVGTAFGGTALIFLGLSGYALTSKRDFSFMGGFLFAGMMVLVVAMLANLFLQMPALSLAISAGIILVMSGFILFDTGRIARGEETNYIMATYGIYLSIFNIFISFSCRCLFFSRSWCRFCINLLYIIRISSRSVRTHQVI